MITALGIRNCGNKAAALICNRFGNIDLISAASVDDIAEIPGIGPKIAESVCEYFSRNGTVDLINKLRNAGLNMEYNKTVSSSVLAGKTVVVTGTMTRFSRSEIERFIEENGGHASSSVSRKTDFVVAGDAAGSKLEKARSLGVSILTEEEFMSMFEDIQ